MNDPIHLVLDPRHLDYIVQVLAQRPYAEVTELMQEISRQVRQQQQPGAVGAVNGEVLRQ